MADLAAAEVQRQLDLPAKTMAWLEHIERPTADCAPVLPDDAEAARLLERLGVQPADRAATLAARPDLEAHPALWWVLDRAYHDLLANMGAAAPTSSYLGWPGLPATAGALGRHLYVWVFLATLPHVRRYLEHHPVPAPLPPLATGRTRDTQRLGDHVVRLPPPLRRAQCTDHAPGRAPAANHPPTRHRRTPASRRALALAHRLVPVLVPAAS
jgi:hypothetical protein